MSGNGRKRLRAAIYTRVSQLKDDDTEVSTANQERRSRAKCDLEGWKVSTPHIFTDSGISAYKDVRRPGWDALQQAVENREVDAVVVFAVSRSARNVVKLAQFYELCKKNDVRFVSATEPIDSGSEWGEIIAMLLGVLAKMESANKSDRLKEYNTGLALTGAPHQGVKPYGYAKDMSIITAEAKVIRGMADRFKAGQTVISVVRQLNADGIPGPRGNGWARSSVRGVMTNPTYIGRRMHRGEDLGPGNWKPILDGDTFAEVADAIMGRKHKKAQSYLLTPFLVCGVPIGKDVDGKVICGGSVGGHSGRATGDGRPFQNYVCKKRRHLAIVADKLEAEVLYQAYGRIPPRIRPSVDPATVNVEYLDKSSEIVRKKDDLRKRYAAGEIPDGDYYRTLTELNEADEIIQRETKTETQRKTRPKASTDVQANLEMLIDKIVVLPAGRGGKSTPAEKRVKIHWRPGVKIRPEGMPERPEPGPLCQVQKCTRPATNREHQLCGAHYARFLKGDLREDEPVREFNKPRPKCRKKNCDQASYVIKERLCKKHYTEERRNSQANPMCRVKGCKRRVDILKSALCSRHYQAKRREIPEVKERRRGYRSTPKSRAKAAAYMRDRRKEQRTA